MAQEGAGRERRLAVIMIADVAGYSRLMHNDEEGTHARLAALLTDVIDPAIAEHGGRIVKHTGDGFLAEFPSAVEAVRAAEQFQSGVGSLAVKEAEEKRIVFRVGINIGDVIVEANDIFGDGVNIAVRLEGIAEAGGICISASAHDQVSGKIDVKFIDLGEHSLKNIPRPVRAYAVKRNGQGLIGQSGSMPHLSSAPRLSIVVLPFTNFGGNPEQDYFVDGITESLTTDLSRIPGAFVIARNTAFTFKNKAVDTRVVGRELGVRYVMEGSVQGSGNRIRVNAQLIDATTGAHLWPSASISRAPIYSTCRTRSPRASPGSSVSSLSPLKADARSASGQGAWTPSTLPCGAGRSSTDRCRCETTARPVIFLKMRFSATSVMSRR
jgi:class 3 adenylate cyclase/TolB-like protein